MLLEADTIALFNILKFQRIQISQHYSSTGFSFKFLLFLLFFPYEALAILKLTVQSRLPLNLLSLLPWLLSTRMAGMHRHAQISFEFLTHFLVLVRRKPKSKVISPTNLEREPVPWNPLLVPRNTKSQRHTSDIPEREAGGVALLVKCLPQSIKTWVWIIPVFKNEHL